MAEETHKYSEVGDVRFAFGEAAVREAASRCHYTRPTIVVHPVRLGDAERVAKVCAYNVETDDSLAEQEWFVKWGQEAYGSNPGGL